MLATMHYLPHAGLCLARHLEVSPSIPPALSLCLLQPVNVQILLFFTAEEL